jgi:hypothetical protein
VRPRASPGINDHRRWLAAATDRSILGRSIVTCLIVGALLTFINHGDEFVRGEFDAGMAWQIGLTFLVPFVVATMSGAAALQGRASRSDAEGQVARPSQGLDADAEPDSALRR